MEQLLVWLIVGIAALYLARQGVLAWRALWSAKGGCSSGCGKCGLAREPRAEPRTRSMEDRPTLVRLDRLEALPPRNKER